MNTRMRHRRMRRKKPKRLTRGMKFGLLWVLGVCFLLFCGLLYNICRYNWDKGDDYKKKVLAQQSYTNAVLDYRFSRLSIFCKTVRQSMEIVT